MKCKVIPFGNLLKEPVRNGLTKPKAIRGQGIKMIAMGEIFANSRIGSINMDRVPVTDKELNNCDIEAGDLLFARQSLALDGAGKCSIITVVDEPTVFESHLIRARIDTSKANPYFLYYYFNSYHGKENIKTIVEQVAAAGIRGSDLIKLNVPCPVLEVQNYIAEILNRFDEKIELNQKINWNLERQAQAIFSERFSGFSVDNLPDGWKAVRLGDVAVISNKSFNPITEPETLLEHYSIPAFDEARFPVFELSTSIKSNKFIVDADCFMISKLNPTTKRVWKPYCISDKAVCSTEFIVYKAREHRYTDFLYSLIDSESFSGFMCSHVTGSTGSRQRTAPSNTLQFEFALPPAEEISAFTAIVQPMYQQIRVNAIENDKLKRIRDTLLPKLMVGEIDVSAVQM